MIPCSRCRVLVAPHARFCSECGTWVVHGAVTGYEAQGASPQPMPPPPAVEMPAQAELAGTLPASAAMIAAVTRREIISEPPVKPAKPIGATQVRTLDTGRPPPPDAVPTIGERPVAPTGARLGNRVPAEGRLPTRTIVDEQPSVRPSLSLGRPPRPLGAFLVSYQYEPLGTFWPLGIGTNIIGRAGAGRPDLDVGIADSTVSGEQALIDVDERGITVEDRGSRNGTSVNGRAIVAGARVPLAHGDRVRFGSFETILVQVPYPAGA
ncbi:MAG: FHA domain-containing protein [Deltaproteobacteria bacterium]|nr:FHA domain-containing protein [Deltaproteobacteria bacterium]